MQGLILIINFLSRKENAPCEGRKEEGDPTRYQRLHHQSPQETPRNPIQEESSPRNQRDQKVRSS